MALIEQFELRQGGPEKVHGGVTCGYRWFGQGGARILQLDTYGSQDREFPGKISQSVQLDETAARELMSILSRAFGRV